MSDFVTALSDGEARQGQEQQMLDFANGHSGDPVWIVDDSNGMIGEAEIILFRNSSFDSHEDGDDEVASLLSSTCGSSISASSRSLVSVVDRPILLKRHESIPEEEKPLLSCALEEALQKAQSVMDRELFDGSFDEDDDVCDEARSISSELQILESVSEELWKSLSDAEEEWRQGSVEDDNAYGKDDAYCDAHGHETQQEEAAGSGDLFTLAAETDCPSTRCSSESMGDVDGPSAGSGDRTGSREEGLFRAEILGNRRMAMETETTFHAVQEVREASGQDLIDETNDAAAAVIEELNGILGNFLEPDQSCEQKKPSTSTSTKDVKAPNRTSALDDQATSSTLLRIFPALILRERF